MILPPSSASPSSAGPPAIQMEKVLVAARPDLIGNAVEETEPADLAEVNWTVSAGDYWVVAGLQSSGKSDFLMMTAGLTPPAGGCYRFFGEPMPIFEEERLRSRLRLGLVFAGGHVFNQLTILENVALPLRYHQNLGLAESVTAAQPLLEALALVPWADNKPGDVPSQWQKRAGLARALALQPEVLLLDDPLVGLDHRQAQWWLDFLDQLSRGHALLQGKPLTLVVTTADLRRWKNRAHQFAVLKDRRFTVLGAWEKLEAAGDELLQELMPLEAPGL